MTGIGVIGTYQSHIIATEHVDTVAHQSSKCLGLATQVTFHFARIELIHISGCQQHAQAVDHKQHLGAFAVGQGFVVAHECANGLGHVVNHGHAQLDQLRLISVYSQGPEPIFVQGVFAINQHHKDALFLSIFNDIARTDVAFASTRISGKHRDLAKRNAALKVPGYEIV